MYDATIPASALGAKCKMLLWGMQDRQVFDGPNVLATFILWQEHAVMRSAYGIRSASEAQATRFRFGGDPTGAPEALLLGRRYRQWRFLRFH